MVLYTYIVVVVQFLFFSRVVETNFGRRVKGRRLEGEGGKEEEEEGPIILETKRKQQAGLLLSFLFSRFIVLDYGGGGNGGTSFKKLYVVRYYHSSSTQALEEPDGAAPEEGSTEDVRDVSHFGMLQRHSRLCTWRVSTSRTVSWERVRQVLYSICGQTLITCPPAPSDQSFANGKKSLEQTLLGGGVGL